MVVSRSDGSNTVVRTIALTYSLTIVLLKK